MLWQYSRKETKVLLVATLLLFSGLGLQLAQDWKNVAPTGSSLSANAVGVYLGVPENEVNTLVAQLDEREAALNAREQEVAAMSQGSADTETLLFITLIGVGLLGLILLNFYLDSRRRYSLAG